MLRKLLPILLLLASFSACQKNSYQTRPSLKLIDQSSVVPADNDAQFLIKLEFTDKEGDLPDAADSSVVYTAVALNVRKLDGGNEYPFEYTRLPDFPDKTSGELEIRPFRRNYYRAVTNPGPDEDSNDTIVMKILIKDRAGNASDTLTTGPIVLLGE
ncbi:hypothetical protein [Flavihumibacter fluvii]|uniref:hypothetical protein n=1 Tax=Flavihumibacter fluvii TaxID=2838157 RepID=UPI001BDEA581|nr:hypothetical protein [Flavihumibacter fluvii]ULQ53530.1 hypothetical protein KJS93_04250 [Flavihumibacter fluvii]